MLSQRQVRTKIRSVEGIRKLTHAIEMISVSKLKNVEQQLDVNKLYFEKLESLMLDLAQYSDFKGHAFFERKKIIFKKVVCVLSSDTGLCGYYNQSVIRKVEEFSKTAGKDNIILITVGKKAFSYFKKRGYNIHCVYTNLRGKYSDAICEKILDELRKMFFTPEVGEIYVCYAQFHSAAKHVPVVEMLVPYVCLDRKSPKREYILEQDASQMLDKLFPVYLKGKMQRVFLSSFASEHGARSLSMHAASDNARDLLEKLITLRNKMRQADITGQLLEVISSSEALRT